MDLSNFHPTEIVEIPAIIKGGTIKVGTPDMNKLTDEQLKLMAQVMGGKLVFLKMRALYVEIEGSQFCLYRGCFSLAEKESDWCESHTNGQ